MAEMADYAMFMRVAVGVLAALAVLHYGAVIVSKVWFRAKLNYQRRLIEGLTGGKKDGKSLEE